MKLCTTYLCNLYYVITFATTSVSSLTVGNWHYVGINHDVITFNCM